MHCFVCQSRICKPVFLLKEENFAYVAYLFTVITAIKIIFHEHEMQQNADIKLILYLLVSA